MIAIIQYNEMAAVLLARLLLGILFFFQGYDAVFNVKIRNVIAAYENEFSNKGIPRFITVCGAWFTSCVELVAGILLFFGLFGYYPLYLLGIALVLASLAFSINNPMWDMRFAFPRMVLLIFLLVVPASWNTLTLDNLLFQH